MSTLSLFSSRGLIFEDADCSVIALDEQSVEGNLERESNKDGNMLMGMLAEQPIPERCVRELFYEPIQELHNTITYHNPLIEMYFLYIPSFPCFRFFHISRGFLRCEQCVGRLDQDCPPIHDRMVPTMRSLRPHRLFEHPMRPLRRCSSNLRVPYYHHGHLFLLQCCWSTFQFYLSRQEAYFVLLEMRESRSS